MTKTIIVGDGPAGLSAALFLAKCGHDAVVYGQDDTPVHKAHFYNYLGIPDMGGTEFQVRAREQVSKLGATLREAAVSEVERSDGGFTVRLEDGAEDDADYVILAASRQARGLAAALGAELVDEGVKIDTDQRTTVDRVYAVGRAARLNRSQAIISAGAGAVAALDILAREAGSHVTDWDTPAGA